MYCSCAHNSAAFCFGSPPMAIQHCFVANHYYLPACLPCSGNRMPLPPFKSWCGTRVCLLALGMAYVTVAAMLLQKPYDTSRAAAWRCAGTWDLIASPQMALMQETLVASHRNKDLLVHTAKRMTTRGHNWDAGLCQIKSK